MAMIKNVLLLTCLFAPEISLLAQENDFGIWFELNTQNKFSKRFESELSAEIRTFSNSSKVQQAFLVGGLQYNFTKNISFTGSYRLISRLEDDGVYYWRHKMTADLNAAIPKRNFTFLSRLRLQRAKKTYIEDAEDLNAKYVIRCRLKANYKIPGVPVKPYLYYEAFAPLFTGSDSGVEKYRLSAGAELKLTFRSEIQAGYIFQRDTKPKIRNMNIISAGYTIKF